MKLESDAQLMILCSVKIIDVAVPTLSDQLSFGIAISIPNLHGFGGPVTKVAVGET